VWREGYTRESIFKLPEARCPLVRDNVVIEVPADQTQFTGRYTREAIRFITHNKDKPFFVYLAHNMPHIPLHASEKFVGSSKRGIYGDTIQELDWSTGEILRSLKEVGLDRDTLVIFTSDNGPNTGKGGSADPLDGKDIWPLLAGKPDAKSPHEAIYYLRGRSVQGIRVGDWKYLIASDKPPKEENSRRLPANERKSKKGNVETLYNLSDDIGEQDNLLAKHPELVARLKKRMAEFNDELRNNTRPAGIADD
jgi:arylsulfatase A-like enzyme